VVNKKILLIAFKFPPRGGVGSRRWAKFAKILARRGYEIDVITPEYPYTDKVNWSHEIQHSNITVHRIKAGVPLMVLKESKNPLEKIIVSIYCRLIMPFFYYLDSAQRWHSNLVPYARNLIRQKNIKNVIVSGPPNSLHYFASFIKIENPLINLILDFRDNWNDDVAFEYKTSLKYFWQKEKSVTMEDFAIRHADKIIFVTEDIKMRYSRIYPIFQDKFTVVYNGFDRDDTHNNVQNEKDFKGIFSFIYTGSLGLGREKAIPLLAQAIDLHEDDFINKLYVDIYSDVKLRDFENHPSFQSIKRHIRFHDMVDPKIICEIISSHSHGLSINSENYPYAFGTKVFDYMVAGKRILHISNGGELYDYLKCKGMFVANYSIFEISSELEKMKRDFQQPKNIVNDYHEFDLEYLTDKIESLLSE
jgi:glycosyltransferase involved in cell wall biosynthesis